jgi:hypothetical protein|tara:strand:- start:467 stop:679 length:213 start_codon:yes stop_codon:yes gene_type:complete
VSTYETLELEDPVVKVKPYKFILSYTVHLGLQEDNDWLGFNNANDAHSKKRELNEVDNVSNINLSAVMGT